jgi:hypothetical protein
MKQDVHVLAVVHGVGAPARCLRWDQFASQRVLGARVAAIAVAWTCWPRGHGPLELALLVLEHPMAFGVSRVSMLRRFIFAAAIDRGERHARSASVGAR